MSASSYNPSKQNSKKPKDIRGGEQKVMKKSLSTILSLAMAFSMFSSVALAAEADATKTSADFTDLKDLDAATKLKFDALISAGVFDGVKEGTFGLKDEMNRAQFAKVAALIFGLKVDTTLKASSFTDVKSDDPANGYALPYIEAVKAAGITDGYAPGQFNPAGKVTKEQLAAFLLRGLNKDAAAKATPGVTDTTVSDWAKGYVALALQLKLLSNGTDGKFGGTSNATRDLLVLSSSEAKSQYKGAPFNGKYAINSFKATDADKLAIQLNGALTDDAAKNLKIEIKNGNGQVVTNYTTKWSDDKTTATLTFDTKFQDGSFVATISGLTNIDDTAKTQTVAVTKERIAKIEFLTAAETLPRTTNKLKIEFKATNQYGAKSSLTYNNFSINTGSDVTAVGVSGEQAFTLQQRLKSNLAAGAAPESALERNDRVSVTIIHEDSGVTANKVFAIGEAQNVAKIEVGDLKNSSNVKIDSVEAQKDTYLDIKAIDQYGIQVQDYDTLNKGVTFYSTEGNVKKVVKDGSNDVWFTTSSEIGDDAADLKFQYSKNEAKDAITLNIIANGSGQAVTKTVKVTASKTPATVEFGSYNYTLAEGDDVTKVNNDTDLQKKFYVPIIVKDAKGDVLTKQEIADKAYKFNIYSTGSINLASINVPDDNGGTRSTPIVQTGEHKGEIAITGASSKGSSGIVVSLQDAPTVRVSQNISVGEKRKADKIAFSAAPKKYQVNGTDNELKLKIYDQHGGELKLNDNNLKVKLELQANTSLEGAYGLSLRSNDVALANGGKVGSGAVATTKRFDLTPSSVSRTVYAQEFLNGAYSSQNQGFLNLEDVFDKSFKFFTNTKDSAGNLITAKPASYTFTARLYDLSGSTTKEINTVTTTLEVLDTADSKNKLKYEAYIDKGVNNTILAVEDYLNNGISGSVTRSTYAKLTKELKVRAKTNSGEDVAVPNTITSVTSSNPSVVAAVADSATTPNKFIVGLDAGTSKLQVVYKDAKGDVYTTPLDVTTKNEGPAIASIAVSKSGNTISRARIDANIANNLFAWDDQLFKKLTIKDQFGNEFVSDRNPKTHKDDDGANTTDQFVQKHSSVLGLTFYATDVILADKALTVAANNTVEINNDGQVKSVGSNVKAFTLNVIAPSGVTASSSIVVNNNEKNSDGITIKTDGDGPAY
ncbi:S-layer homology domain-containing protein [Paenibacillus sp. WQ 127069]|uniref:S-layer homology domain-containing protein n=1 Tax=Paenibacillus baimaensis TaxID=2982185 RepID=A0ABT2UE89_9BACL|nr:S-layer homology domain-containing protein [Paenibacillus sp. WQ 127069]MCU6792959.1 S-layer homology domain-containing protein [Paenibacillus sp. WQ 127069]